MKKHFAHYLLILMLAVAPMQSVLAGLSALEHASACETGAMDDHAAMNHDKHENHDMGSNTDKTDAQCSCCADCMTMCASAAQVSYPASGAGFDTSVLATSTAFTYQLANSSQHPFADIRPPIVLL